MKKKKKAYMKNRLLWEKALRFVLNVSKMRKQFLEEDMFGISPLIMRACGTVAAFISEAGENNYPKEQLRCLSVSQEALFECIHYLAIIDEEGYGNTVKLTIEAEHVSVLLESYINALKK
jgi:four helix bundle protein